MPGYFRAMGIPLKKGRDFTAADNDSKAPYRFIVNERFVGRYLKGEQPVGKQISALMDNTNPFGEIVGVVGDVKEDAVDQEPAPTVYYIYNHLPYPAMTFAVRTAGDPLALVGPVRHLIQGLDPAQPIAEVRTMRTIVAETFSRQRFSAMLLSGFSLASLLLAGVGIYGVLAYSVTERTREIGVRVALGAARADHRDGCGDGRAAGIWGVRWRDWRGRWLLTGLLRSMLFGVGAHDAATFATVPVVLASVALLAAYMPARRASRMPPVDALRAE